MEISAKVILRAKGFPRGVLICVLHVLFRHAHEQCSMKQGLNVPAKSIDQVSLRTPRRLTLVETFCYGLNFCMSRNRFVSGFSRLLDKIDFIF